MATEEKPIWAYFIVNMMIVALVVFSAGYVYLNFFAGKDKPEEDEEATSTEQEKQGPLHVSRQVSKAAFSLAGFLAAALIVLYMIDKATRSKGQQF